MKFWDKTVHVIDGGGEMEGGRSPAPHGEDDVGSQAIPWKIWLRDRLLSQYFGFPLIIPSALHTVLCHSNSVSRHTSNGQQGVVSLWIQELKGSEGMVLEFECAYEESRFAGISRAMVLISGYQTASVITSKKV